MQRPCDGCRDVDRLVDRPPAGSRYLITEKVKLSKYLPGGSRGDVCPLPLRLHLCLRCRTWTMASFSAHDASNAFNLNQDHTISGEVMELSDQRMMLCKQKSDHRTRKISHTIQINSSCSVSILQSAVCLYYSLQCVYTTVCSVSILQSAVCLYYSLQCVYTTVCSVSIPRSAVCLYYSLQCVYTTVCSMSILQSAVCLYYSLQCVYTTVCGDQLHLHILQNMHKLNFINNS